MPHLVPIKELEQLARSQCRRKDYDGALQSLEEAISQSECPSASLLDTRAAIYERKDDLNAALKDARSTIKLHENDATGYLRAGKILQKTDKHGVALEIYKRGLKKARSHVGTLQKMHDNLSEALKSPVKADPFTFLPVELVEMILKHLKFKELVICTRVSRTWQSLTSSLPSMWQHLDLAGASKLVPSAFISRCINRSKGRLHTATLYRVANFNAVVKTLMRQCHQLNVLSIDILGLYTSPFVENMALGTRLRELDLQLNCDVDMYAIPQLLVACPLLKRLRCQRVQTSPGDLTWPVDLPNLEDISLEAPFVTLTAEHNLNLQCLIERAPNLRKIVLNWATLVRASELLDMRSLSKLESLSFNTAAILPRHVLPSSIGSLSIRSMPLVTRPDQAVELSTLPHLEHLTCLTSRDAARLLSLPHVIDRFPDCEAHHVQNWSSLKTLRIFDHLYEDPFIVPVLTSPRAQRLEQLYLRGARKMDDVFAPLIASNCVQLKTLSLQISDITGVGVRCILNGLEHLEELWVEECSSISADAIDWARSRGVKVIHSSASSTKAGRKVRYG